MKYLTVFILTLSLALSSCSDEWLNDIEPQGKLLEANYYQTEEEMSQALVAVYNVFKNQYWQGTWSGWYMFASLGSDDAVTHGGGASDRPEFWDIDEYEVNALNPALPPLWNRSYYGIFRANTVIANVDPESDFGKIAIAESKMLRAYFHFELIRFFGDVPLVDHVLTPDEYNMARTPKEEVFDFIIKDLEEAAPVLPVRWAGGDAYRMTRYAAIGLKAKVHTYMASPFYGMSSDNYTKAAEAALDVINNGGYALEANFDDVWHYTNEFNNETLIEMSYGYMDAIEYWDNGANTTGNVIQQLNGVRGFTGGNDTIRNGWGFDMITQDLVSQYRAQGDSTRLHATALGEWQLNEWGYAGGEKNEGYTGYYTKKRATWYALNPDGNTWGWGNNERILRLSEIYLLYAEALANTGDDAGARAAVDVVRNRAGLGSISDVEAAQGLSLIDAIKLERRLELAQEGNRYFDLIRWNDTDVLVPLGFQKDKNEYFPIPQVELDATPAITQNPGY